MGKFLQNLLRRSLPHRIRNIAGQHSIEYAVVLIVVMAAIIIGGRYVIRSWNANMKYWEDSAIDSMIDPMLTAPPIGLGPCTCSLEPFGCGPVGGCAENEQYQQCVCTPLGCGMGNPAAGCGATPEGSGICVCEDTCCTVPVPTGNCGPPACPLRTEQHTFQCGCAGPLQTSCIWTDFCSNDCEAPIRIPLNSSGCPGWNINMPSDMGNVLVDDCTAAPPSGHCQLYCNPPFWPDATRTLCGLCPAGQVLQGACPAGQCETPILCPSGFCNAG